MVSPFLLVLIIYGIVIIIPALLFSRHIRRVSDFYVAGRKLNSTLLFSTLLAANIGAGSTVGAAALGFSKGLSAWWWVGSAGIGSLVLAFTLGPRIRRYAARYNYLTVGDFLEHRYNRNVKGIISVILWLGGLAILAGQLMAFSRILEVVAGTGKTTGSILGGIVVITYFSATGLKGTAWINMFQLMVKGAGFLLALPLALAAIGGWDSFMAGVQVRSMEIEGYSSFFGSSSTDILHYLVLLVPSFMVSPGILQKIYGARDDRTVRIGVAANGVSLLIFSFFPVILGMMAAVSLSGLSHPDLALPSVITEMVPFWVGALLLAAIFSAEISSADAVLFMLSTSLGQDLYKTFINPNAGEKRMLSASRITSVSAGILAVLLSTALPSVISALEIFYSLLSASLFVPVIWGLYHSKPGPKACIQAVSASLLLTVIIHFLTDGTGISFLSPVAFGILSSLVLFALAGTGNRIRSNR
ncbi:MAG: sodium:solute symporter family protein [Acidobacteriota bacterium]